jgi:hypothetical protein
MKKILTKITPIIIFTFFTTSCGGGGGGGESDSYTLPAPPATSNISLSSEKGYIGEDIIITWSSTNATSCSASNAWTGTKDTSGSESYSLDAAGSFTFEISCTGSGGTSVERGSSSASIDVFKYDKQTDDVANKNWNASAFGLIYDIDLSNFPKLIWVLDGSTILTTSAFEPPDDTFEINYSFISSDGSSFDFNAVFDDWNELKEPLYNPEDKENPTYKLLKTTDGDSIINGVFTLPDYYSNLGIDYVSYGLTEVFTDSQFHILPTIFGEFTQTEDVPISGTSIKEFESLGFLVCFDEGGDFCSVGDLIVADGTGTLNFDFSNNTFSGSLIYDAFASYKSFKNGSDSYNLLTEPNNQTVPIKNGTISGNEFYAVIENITSQDIEVSIEAKAYGSGNVYVIDGVQNKSLTLNVGTTYYFLHPVGTHPLRLSTTSDGIHGDGVEYTNWVTYGNQSTTIEINAGTPSTLYYYCDIHPGMGSDITVNPNPNAGFYYTGVIQGHFFGPNAEEMGTNIMFMKDDVNNEDGEAGASYILSAGGVGQSE